MNSTTPYGFFHLSLTVLVHYRLKEFLGLEGGSPFFVKLKAILLKLFL